MSTTVRRIINGGSPRNAAVGKSSMRSYPSQDSKTAYGEDGVGEHFADLLGVRAVFQVEENEYMRDKALQYATFGLAGKRSISGGSNLAETQVGTVWKPRILMISNSMIMLFNSNKNTKNNSSSNTNHSESLKKTSSSPPGQGFNNGSALDNPTTGKLISRAGDLKTSVVMEDVSFACEFDDPRGSGFPIIQIRTTSVTGLVKTTLIKMESNKQLHECLDALEQGLKSYRVALSLLRSNEIDENGYHSGSSTYQITSIGQKLQNGRTHLIDEHPEQKKFVSIDGISRDEPIQIYIKGPNNSKYLAILVPYQLEIAAEKNDTKSASIRGDYLSSNKGDVGHKKEKPLSLFIEAQSIERGTTNDNSLPEKEESTKSLSNIKNNKGICFILSETKIVMVVCFVVLLAIITPEAYYKRKNILMLLTLPVTLVMLLVRSKQGHKAILELSKPKSMDNTSMNNSVNNNKFAFTFRITDIRLGEEKDTMRPEDTKQSYLDRHSTDRKLSALAITGAMGGKSKRNISSIDGEDCDPIDVLLVALKGCHDESLTDDDCPQKWFDATDGKKTDAIRQWRESLQWRKENDIDNILTRPSPNYFVIRDLFPACYFLGLGKSGHLVTLDKFGHIKQNVNDMLKQGIDSAIFADWCVLQNEYWIQNKLTKTGRLYKIVDLKGLSTFQITSSVIEYMKPMNHAMQQYPELIIKLIIVNAPSSFRFIWKIACNFLAKKTTEKIKIPSAKEALEIIKEEVPLSILPKDYGGEWDNDYRNLEMELQRAQYVRQLNYSTFGAPSKGDWSPELAELPTATVYKENNDSATTMDDNDGVAQLLQGLNGQWISVNEQSENMNPILDLMGKSLVDKKSAQVSTEQMIQVSGLEKKTVLITTKASQVVNSIEGILNDNAPIQAANVEEEEYQIKSTNILPKNIADVSQPIAIVINFTLPNKDTRSVYHALDKNDMNKKYTSISYSRMKDGKTATVKIVSKRK